MKKIQISPDACRHDHHADIEVLPAFVGEGEAGHAVVADELRHARVAVDLEAEVLDHAAEDGVSRIIDLPHHTLMKIHTRILVTLTHFFYRAR